MRSGQRQKRAMACASGPSNPETAEVEALVRGQGIDGFRQSVQSRQACCEFARSAACPGARGGIGLGHRPESGQSAARSDVAILSPEPAQRPAQAQSTRGMDREAVLAFTLAHDVPVNALHAQGFPSIGCAPCTRAIQPGEPERAGRWWWEDEAKKECGLHIGADGRLTRRLLAETGA